MNTLEACRPLNITNNQKERDTLMQPLHDPQNHKYID